MLIKSSSICLEARVLNTGKNKYTKRSAKHIAANDKMIDSPKNCPIISILEAPTTFRIPTSLALFMERAVERFMKLIHAIKRMITAIIENRYTYIIGSVPFKARRWISFSGCRPM